VRATTLARPQRLSNALLIWFAGLGKERAAGCGGFALWLVGEPRLAHGSWYVIPFSG
jgi:hypothetical protein